MADTKSSAEDVSPIERVNRADSAGTYFSEKKDALDQQSHDKPTAEELVTLRRVASKIPLNIYSIAFIQLCERFSWYGTVIVYTNFIQMPMPEGSTTGAPLTRDGQPGVLGMGQQASTSITLTNMAIGACMPLLGAYIADQHLGRYKTICAALVVAILGHLVLVVAASPPVLAQGPSNALGALITGMLTVSLGAGGFLPNISPMIAEQIDTEKGPRVIVLPKTGERVIEDPAVTINRVYNWFYLFINIGALVGQISMVYAEAYVGFWLSFLLPAIILCFCPSIMWWGRKRFKTRKPAGSALSKALRTFLLANKGRWHILPWVTYQRLNDGTFWENVKPSKFAPGTKPKWMTFDDAWVDELQRGFAACQVFLWYPIYWLSYGQMNNNLISQAATMKLDGVPNDLLTNLDPITLIILIPIFDFVIYPFLRKHKINFTPLKKITAGFLVGGAGMIWAAVVQNSIYSLSECGNMASGTTATGDQCPPATLSVWAQTGSYVLIALSEILASITSLEYAFSKAPKNMRSTVQAIAMFMTAISSALAVAFVPLSTDPLLVWNYGSTAVIAIVGGALFWWVFRELDSKEGELNELPEGKLFADRDEED
ncbi:hypothetical protein MCOR02_010805 [Pyricularia oryzae]|nr:hypothetical protein MCOR02_010805 [Pyricularia oryzae]KAI6323391.1 hypothetical protein MCOR34_001848 [Pyricularia oryzae]KAI6486445.1 hypothetical protein MCOR13_009457 [Pyricularia oryzae]KAI6566866.1 hypothetical protein MCOR04_008705 [Pyricularia oryzae]